MSRDLSAAERGTPEQGENVMQQSLPNRPLSTGQSGMHVTIIIIIIIIFIIMLLCDIRHITQGC